LILKIIITISFKVLNHAQTNGVIEVTIKNLPKVIKKEYLIREDKLNLEQCTIGTLEYYNYKKSILQVIILNIIMILIK